MNLVPLYEEAIQFNNFNGTVLAAGKVEVWYLGRTRKADIYADVAGETPLPNPFDLNDLGMQEVYVNPAFNYTLVVYDPYGSELFSVDKYLQGVGAHTTSNVVVQPSEHIGVSAWTVGEVQIYQPYLTGQLGKVYTGIEPIVVNNTEDKISANHVPLGVQDPLYFVQDDEEGCIIGLSGGIVPEGTMNESALGYQDGQITSYNGSAFSAGLNYEAGSNIDITDNVISGKDWSNEINDASAAATAWTNSQGYLTGVDLSEYTKRTDFDAAISSLNSTKLDVDVYSSQSALFLTAHQSLEGYATEQWVENKGYLTAVPEGYATTGDLQTVSGEITAMIPSTAGLATENWVTSQGYLTAHQSLDGLMSASLLEQSGGLITGYNGTAFAGQGGGVTGDFELSAGSGISIVDYPLEQKTVISVTAQGGNTAAEQAVIDNSATWNTVSNKLDTTAFSDVSGTFLTAHQDLSDYQTTAGMTAYLTTGDSAEFMTTAERSDYIPTGVSSEFYTTANTAGYISEVPDTYLQNTDLSTEDGKVTAISGIPLSAGGDVPEGVMVESGLEYNAVNEISGYNGSAIAQYGAEKQWLVHDDTIVSISNSAQYAFGCNISALQRLMGIDETVLFEDSNGHTGDFTTTEPFTNFNEVSLYVTPETGPGICVNKIILPMIGNNTTGLRFAFDTTWLGFKNISFTFNYNNTGMSAFSPASGSWFGWNHQGAIQGDWASGSMYIYKVIGIGRKQ